MAKIYAFIHGLKSEIYVLFLYYKASSYGFVLGTKQGIMVNAWMNGLFYDIVLDSHNVCS